MLVRKRWGHVFAAALGFALMAAAAAHAQLPFSAPLNISNNTDSSFTPQLAVDSAGNLYAVWEDDTSTNSNILFSRSTDGGATFSAPSSLSHTSGFSFSPRIIADALGGIDVVWADTSPGHQHIFFSRSMDSGATFSAPIDISNGDSAGNPEIAADASGRIFVVWENDTGVLGIYFTASTDGGVTFASPRNLATNTGGSFVPQIVVDPAGKIGVAWEDDSLTSIDISFSHSSDHGASFSAAKSLSLGVGNSTSVHLAADASGNINAVWENDSPGNIDIFFSRSTDGGQSFSAPRNLSNTPGNTRTAQIALDSGGNINLVWTDNVPPAFSTDIFFTRSTDGGVSFSPAQNLSNNPGMSANPQLTVDAAGKIDVVWEDATFGNRDILFSQSTDAGATFSSPQNLSNNPGLSSVPLVVADKKAALNVIWQDAITATGASQVLFSRFTPKVTNHAPIADAGADQSVPATSPSGASVQLDGSKSSDPDGDTLTYSWTDESNNVVGTAAVIQVTVPVGTHRFTLTVTDTANLTASAVTRVTVVNQPPVANAGPDQSFDCVGPSGVSVTLNGSGSSDADGDALSFVWKDETGSVVGNQAMAQVNVLAGSHTFTLSVTDAGGLSSTATTHVTAHAASAAALRVSLSPNPMWPADNRLHLVRATVQATGGCSANPAVKLVAITSSETEHRHNAWGLRDMQAVGGGAIAFGTDVRSFLLRAERQEWKHQLVYTVTYALADGSAKASAQVVIADPEPKRHHEHDRDADDEGHDKDRHDKDRHDKDHHDEKDHGENHDHGH